MIGFGNKQSLYGSDIGLLNVTKLGTVVFGGWLFYANVFGMVSKNVDD